MMRLLLAAAIAVACVSAPATAATVSVGEVFGWTQPYIDFLVTTGLSASVAWVLYLAQAKFKLNIDDSHRDALQTWLLRQASSLVADGFVKVGGLQFNVDNAALANAATLAGKEIPQALAHFGLTPDRLAEMIKDKIPHVPAAVAAVAPAVAAAAPAVPAK